MTVGRFFGRRFVCAVLLLLSLPQGARGGPRDTASSPLGDLLVPGGVGPLFRAANLAPPRDRAYALLTLSRLLYRQPSGGDQLLDASARRLREYLDVLGQWSVRLAPFPDGIALSQVQSHKTGRELVDLLAFVGLSLRESREGYSVERHDNPQAARRRAALRAAGLDLDGVDQQLNAGATVDLGIQGDRVPLPLAEAVWVRAVFENRVPPEALFARLIGEREALWLYGGLLGLDAETLRFFEAQTDLLAWIHRDRAALFGAFGRSVRLRDGHVETPGGAARVGLWESLAGVPANEPVRFVRALLDRDAGRLAWFYDSVAHLPPDRQSIVAGGFLNDDSERHAWWRAVYSAFLAFHASWDVSVRPFARRTLDPALAIHLLQLTPDGHVAGPPWAPFWEEALSGGDVPGRAPDSFERLDGGDVATLPWMLGKIFARPVAAHRALFDRALFAGRVFGRIGPERAFDALVALRGFGRYPALMLVLESMGIREPALYAEAARAAEAVSASASAQTLAVRTAVFQGAVALLDRLREVRALDTPTTSALARSLFAARPAADGWYRGAIVSWLDREVLPALGSAHEPDAAEARLMSALAGMPRAPAQAGPLVEWRGRRYRVDLARDALARLLKVRQKQGGPHISAILTAWRSAAASAAQAVEPGEPAPGRGESVLDHLGPGDWSVLLGPPLPRSAPPLRLVDRAAAEWLASLAYAVRIRDAGATLLLGVNPALKHELGTQGPSMAEAGETAWTIPAPVTGPENRPHLEGSLLGLALPLSRHAVTRLETQPPRHPPTVHGRDAWLFAASAALFNPLDVTDEERDLIAGAVRRGRARVTTLLRDATGWWSIADELAADEWERQLVPWMLAREPDGVPARLSAHDLFVLGGVPGAGRADAWGMLAQPVDGSLFLRLPTPALRRALADRSATGALVTQLCDLPFRVAEFLGGARLPASLGRALLAVAVPEFLELALLSHDDDWPGLVAAARAITGERFEDYLSTLMSDGPLVPLNPASTGTVPSEAECLLRQCS
jgi:hypothetical protein